jgi:hypothetical protein
MRYTGKFHYQVPEIPDDQLAEASAQMAGYRAKQVGIDEEYTGKARSSAAQVANWYGKQREHIDPSGYVDPLLVRGTRQCEELLFVALIFARQARHFVEDYDIFIANGGLTNFEETRDFMHMGGHWSRFVQLWQDLSPVDSGTGDEK